ncbi:MAG: hypothetical protein RMJ98_09285 [Myxococcales bacterium]|nr:hypothetical protein [Myxococcales bacterium]
MIHIELGGLVGGEDTSIHLAFQSTLDVANEAGRREAEALHEDIAKARGKRGDLSILLLNPCKALSKLVKLPEPLALLLGTLGGDVSARETEEGVEVGADLFTEAADCTIGPGRIIGSCPEVVKDEKAYRLSKGGIVLEETGAPVEFVEHAGTYLCMTEEMHLPLGGDGSGAHFANVVEQCRPADLKTILRLTDHLLGMLPDILVTPLTVTKADQSLHLRK